MVCTKCKKRIIEKGKKMTMETQSKDIKAIFDYFYEPTYGGYKNGLEEAVVEYIETGEMPKDEARTKVSITLDDVKRKGREFCSTFRMEEDAYNNTLYIYVGGNLDVDKDKMRTALLEIMPVALKLEIVEEKKVRDKINNV